MIPEPSFIPFMRWTSSRNRKKFFNDIFKSVLVFVYALGCWVFTSFMIMIVDQTLPDLSKHGFGLPDAFFDRFEYRPEYIELSEAAMAFVMIIFVLIIIFHKHRFVIFRRWSLICGTLFIGRGLSLWMTRLPVANSYTTICYEIYEQGKLMSFMDNLKGAFKITFALGAQGEGSGIVTCGDLIYSGHCIIATTVSMIIWKYVLFRNRAVRFIQGVCLLSLYLVGIVGLLVSRTHYLVDIFLAFLLTWFLFCYYHFHVDKLRRKNVGVEFNSELEGDEVETVFDIPLIPFFSFFEKDCEVVESEFEFLFWKCIPLEWDKGDKDKESIE